MYFLNVTHHRQGALTERRQRVLSIPSLEKKTSQTFKMVSYVGTLQLKSFLNLRKASRPLRKHPEDFSTHWVFERRKNGRISFILRIRHFSSRKARFQRSN